MRFLLIILISFISISGFSQWVCGESITDVRDGKTYNTVLINTQCWLRENLNIGTFINSSTTQTDNGMIEKWCYNNDTSKCNTYGGLYQWAEAMQYYNGVTNSTHWAVDPTNLQGICPSGWHIPTLSEVNALVSYLGSSTAGGKLKATGYDYWMCLNAGAVNSVNFNSLGSGWIYNNSSNFLKQCSIRWTITQGVMNTAVYVRGETYKFSTPLLGDIAKISGVSVRCIKN